MGADTFKQNPEITERRVDDIVFLVNSDSETMFHLNELGSAVWRLFSDSTPVYQAVEFVQQAFPEISPEQVKTDVIKLVDDLNKQGLIN